MSTDEKTDEWKKVMNYRYSHLHSHLQPGNKYFGPNYNNVESGKKQFVNNWASPQQKPVK
jgi:hypothetical protein